MTIKGLLVAVGGFLLVGLSNSNLISPGVLLKAEQDAVHLIGKPDDSNTSKNDDKLIFAHVVSEHIRVWFKFVPLQK